VVSAVPSADYKIKTEHLKEGVICINVSGEKNFEKDVRDKVDSHLLLTRLRQLMSVVQASIYLPNVGSVTITMLLRNLYAAHESCADHELTTSAQTPPSAIQRGLKNYHPMIWGRNAHVDYMILKSVIRMTPSTTDPGEMTTYHLKCDCVSIGGCTGLADTGVQDPGVAAPDALSEGKKRTRWRWSWVSR
jgi:hypothetical protein